MDSAGSKPRSNHSAPPLPRRARTYSIICRMPQGNTVIEAMMIRRERLMPVNMSLSLQELACRSWQRRLRWTDDHRNRGACDETPQL